LGVFKLKIVGIVLAIAGVVTAVGVFAAIYSDGKTDNQEQSESSAQSNKKFYVAMGDSVAAGVGLADAYDSSACQRSQQSYPVWVANQSGAELLHSACSGATIDKGVSGSQTVNRLQLDSQIEQMKQSGKTPAYISLTIGANDVNWLDLLQRCYQDQCGSLEDDAQIQSSVAALQRDAVATINTVTSMYPKATLVVTGYYQLFSKNLVDNCEELTGFDQDELNFARSIQTSINQALRTAVQTKERAVFSPVDFDGHELCTKNPWVQTLRESAPYHPTESGQVRIAEGITSKLKGL